MLRGLAQTLMILGITILLLIGIEGFSYFMSSDRKSSNFFINLKKPKGNLISQKWDQDSKTLSFYDPLLGYAHNPKIFKKEVYKDSYVVYGSEKQESTQDKIRIVVYGGSTSEPVFKNSWPKVLENILRKKGHSVEVYNGAVAGYSTSQELLKLVRDLNHLKPDMVLSLNGVNDLNYIHVIKSHPLHKKYHTKIARFVLQEKSFPFMPFTLEFLMKGESRTYLRGVQYGPKNEKESWEVWETNLIKMKAITEAFHVEFFAFLQPILGFGNFSMSEEEKVMMKTLESKKASYLKDLRQFYGKSQDLTNKHDFLTDLTQIFERKSHVFEDPRHQNEKGRRIVAKRIAQFILKSPLFQKDYAKKI